MAFVYLFLGMCVGALSFVLALTGGASLGLALLFYPAAGTAAVMLLITAQVVANLLPDTSRHSDGHAA